MYMLVINIVQIAQGLRLCHHIEYDMAIEDLKWKLINEIIEFK